MSKKTILPFLSILLLFFGIFSTAQPLSVSAGSKTQNVSGWKQDCKITSIGKQCGPRYKDYNITAKWTKSDVVAVTKNINKYTSNSYGFATFVAGYVSGPLGIVMTLNGMGWNTVSGKFNTAKTKGTGLTYTYVYRLSEGGTTTTSGKVISSKWSYK